ncbi:division/outer membrane stress-associated lipid-binding lipoprotein [Lacimicrobium alkaliphilum]|uniref:BON domain-containing protein n=1 Tax=Lacimicrobium alkaliphilum TaxID=1526571 RepID=A0ABQ1QZE6_9ALTE|nr:division/outer membrane stress-associated lipid-binding lipoprotein [Lacimicrobium alkaliphilum]GGD51096.1 BON domain-containing protein [Lacimicrobium alkaliphilum]
MKRTTKLLTLIVSIALLQGCAAVVIGAGVGAAAVAHDRRTVGTQLDDKTLASRINSALSENNNIKQHAHINATVFNGVTLLVGQAPNDDLKRQAQQITEAVPHVTKLHNQIRISSPTVTSIRTHDVWLATKVRSKLLTDKSVDGLHIKVIVEDSEVFLMGLVTRQESDKAVEVARNIDGVARVVKAFEYL